MIGEFVYDNSHLVCRFIQDDEMLYNKGYYLAKRQTDLKLVPPTISRWSFCSCDLLCTWSQLPQTVSSTHLNHIKTLLQVRLTASLEYLLVHCTLVLP